MGALNSLASLGLNLALSQRAQAAEDKQLKQERDRQPNAIDLRDKKIAGHTGPGQGSMRLGDTADDGLGLVEAWHQQGDLQLGRRGRPLVRLGLTAVPIGGSRTGPVAKGARTHSLTRASVE